MSTCEPPLPQLVAGRRRASAAARRRDHADAVKRRAYLVVLGLSTMVLMAFVLVDGVHVSYWGLAYPALAAYNAALAAVIWRRRMAIRVIEALILGMLVAVLLGFLAAWRLAPTRVTAEATDLTLVMLWAGLSFPLCFLVFGTRRGLQVSLAIYVGFLLLVVPPAVSGDIPAGSAESPTVLTFSLAAFFAVMIALLWVLASRLEALAVARTQADVFAAQATTDGLTGLPNRRRLDEELDRQIGLARDRARPLTVAFIDIDHFKAVNDRFGHEAGDHVLVDVAHRLVVSVRDSDLVGRWGGEEFLLVAPQTGYDAGLELAERCRARIAATNAAAGPITASFGVASLDPSDDAASLLRRADLALYRAKGQGRDRVVGLRETITAAGVTEPALRG